MSNLKELGRKFASIKKDVKQGGDPVAAFVSGYEIVEQVGELGMSKFYKAMDGADKRIEALSKRPGARVVMYGATEAQNVVLTLVSQAGSKEIKAAQRMEGWLVFIRNKCWKRFADAQD